MSEALEAHLRHQIDDAHRFFWHRLRWRVVRSYLPDATPFEIIDVGAGAGVLGTFVQRDRPRATYRFVEPIDSLRSFLRTRYGNAADAGDETAYETARFVTLLDVLEHQEDDHAFLAALVGKMTPGSTLLLTVPAQPGLWSQWDVSLGHFRRYDKAALLACTKNLPLTVHETTFLFPEMVPLAMIRRRRKHANPSDEDAEFPELPRVANDLLYGAGTASLALRRHWPTGTSIFMAATRDD